LALPVIDRVAVMFDALSHFLFPSVTDFGTFLHRLHTLLLTLSFQPKSHCCFASANVFSVILFSVSSQVIDIRLPSVTTKIIFTTRDHGTYNLHRQV